VQRREELLIWEWVVAAPIEILPFLRVIPHNELTEETSMRQLALF
jgi:hypothetical protein